MSAYDDSVSLEAILGEVESYGSLSGLTFSDLDSYIDQVSERLQRSQQEGEEESISEEYFSGKALKDFKQGLKEERQLQYDDSKARLLKIQTLKNQLVSLLGKWRYRELQKDWEAKWVKLSTQLREQASKNIKNLQELPQETTLHQSATASKQLLPHHYPEYNCHMSLSPAHGITNVPAQHQMRSDSHNVKLKSDAKSHQKSCCTSWDEAAEYSHCPKSVPYEMIYTPYFPQGEIRSCQEATCQFTHQGQFGKNQRILRSKKRTSPEPNFKLIPSQWVKRRLKRAPRSMRSYLEATPTQAMQKTSEAIEKQLREIKLLRSQPTESIPMDQVRTWLHNHQLLDPKLDDTQLIRRYKVMSSIKFGSQVTHQAKLRFMSKLCPMEHMLAASQSDIGCITNPKYEYKLQLNDVTPFEERAIRYPPAIEDWLDDYIQDLLTTGVITPVGPLEETPMVTGLVLVPQGQSGQPFRVCQNVIPVNKRTPEYQRVLTDCSSILQRLRRKKWASMIDLKAGYHNIPFEQKSSKYATWVCHRGKFRWLRMPFGLTQAPAHFQWVMEDIIHGQPDGVKQEPVECQVYLDDLTVTSPDDTLDSCLDATVEVIRRITSQGAMVNLRKSVIGAHEGVIVGHNWQGGGYFRANDKKLKALLEIPDEELQKIPRASLYGLLLYFRGYVPDFAIKTEPLRKLLAQDHLPWTPACTQAVRDTTKAILEGVPYLNYDPDYPLRVEVQVGPQGLVGLLLQQDPSSDSKEWLPVGSHARTLQPTEPSYSKVELELIATQEVLSKLRHMTVFAKSLEIVASPELRTLMRCWKRLHPSLQWLVTDLRQYNPTFIAKVKRYPANIDASYVGSWEQAEVHLQDQEIEDFMKAKSEPAFVPKLAQFVRGPHVHLQFDGGAKRGTRNVGTAGFIIADSEGNEVVRTGINLGEGVTNNQAEARALFLALNCLVDLQQQGVPNLHAPVRVFGDSQLIIKFMTKQFKQPRQSALYHPLMRAQQLVKDNKMQVAYRNIPREANKVADDMCRRAEATQKVSYQFGDLPEDAPQLDLRAPYESLHQSAATVQLPCTEQEEFLQQQFTSLQDKVKDKACEFCHQMTQDKHMIICERCFECYHQECIHLADQPVVHQGPWYCQKCRGAIVHYGFRDVTEDIGLIDHLYLGHQPVQLEEAARIKSLTKKFRAGNGYLQALVPSLKGYGHIWVNVPTMVDRVQITKDTHDIMGHLGREKLLDALRTTYFWPKMRATVQSVIKGCQACQKDKIPPVPREPYMPTNRPAEPFEGWSIDLAGPFPKDEDGNQYLAVAVDCATKWVEAMPIPSKHAFRTADWFFSQVVSRWGKPKWIRTDNGSEWAADFGQLIEILGIKHHKITVGNSKANGQVERTIRTCKDVIRKCLSSHPHTFWSGYVPAALLLLNHSTAKSHGFPPFSLVTGRLPALLSAIMEDIVVPAHELSEEQEEEVVQKVYEAVLKLMEVTNIRLTRTEIKLRSSLRAQEQSSTPQNMLEHYQEGDLVMKRVKKLGKIEPKADGPYRVVKTSGKYLQRVHIHLQDWEGKRKRAPKTLVVHSSQLSCWRPEYMDPSSTDPLNLPEQHDNVTSIFQQNVALSKLSHQQAILSQSSQMEASIGHQQSTSSISNGQPDPVQLGRDKARAQWAIARFREKCELAFWQAQVKARDKFICLCSHQSE